MKYFFRKYSPAFIASVIILGFLIIISCFPTPLDPEAQNLMNRFQPPDWRFMQGEHPLGTDFLGRDMLSRMISGTRISFFIAFFGTIIGAILGTILGYVSAKCRGLVDEAIMMMVDIQASLPFLIIAIAFVSMFKNSFLVIVILLGFAGWEKYARLTRGLSLSALNQGYAIALKTVGASPNRVFFRHILPNISSTLIVNMTLNFPGTMIAESSLSFLGLGIQPPYISLGRLLGEGRVYLLTAWWIAIIPGMVIFVSALAITLIGDSFRDLFLD